MPVVPPPAVAAAAAAMRRPAGEEEEEEEAAVIGPDGSFHCADIRAEGLPVGEGIPSEEDLFAALNCQKGAPAWPAACRRRQVARPPALPCPGRRALMPQARRLLQAHSRLRRRLRFPAHPVLTPAQALPAAARS